MSPDVPAWARDAVFYQIFPDRFAASHRVERPGSMQAWDAPPTVHGFKGGDLLGVVERLHELDDLGINALYLNPIFSAASNHRYNAYDFLAVDPLLGGNAALRELLDAAHGRGMRVILDGVFNHAGRGFWPFQHVLESGGNSPYRDWFYLDDDVLDLRRGILAQDELDPAEGPRGYRSWWNVPSLPKLRIEDPAVREYVLGVAEHWTRFGIDGWRLDVPTEIADPTFWPEFRARVRAVNPQAYLVGEIWHEAPDWLTGERFDALMNYPLTLAILGFVGGPHLDRAIIARQSNYRDGLVALDGRGFGERLLRNLTLNHPDSTAVQFNLLGSHDTPRAMSVLGQDARRLKLAMLLQLTLPGAPSIYYGDEIAMTGGPDPDCRGAYPADLGATGETALAVRSFVRDAIAARHSDPALRGGVVLFLDAADRAVALERFVDGRRALVIVNAGEASVTLSLGSPGGAGLRQRQELTIGTARIADDGSRIQLDGRSAVVYVQA